MGHRADTQPVCENLSANATDAVQMGLKAQPLAELGWACAQRAMADPG